MIRFSFISLLAFGQPAIAYISSEGHEYQPTCTTESVMLKSVSPVTRIIENGANTKYVKGTEELVLTADCLAHTEVFGYGRWEWANGGFWITFPTYEIRFPRQELYCVSGEPDPLAESKCGGF